MVCGGGCFWACAGFSVNEAFAKLQGKRAKVMGSNGNCGSAYVFLERRFNHRAPNSACVSKRRKNKSFSGPMPRRKYNQTGQTHLQQRKGEISGVPSD
eukprot:3435532-Rhodomonas_salina.1